MKRLLFSLALVAFLISACSDSKATQTPVTAPDTSLPALDELDQDWNMLSPGGETICSNGTEYAFFVHPGDTEKLLIYFQGGGACWFGEICDLKASPTYDPYVDTTDNPALSGFGIFDLDNPENPFADYSMVFVPYCTADVHIGDSVRTYQVPATDDTPAHEVTIYHKGYVNATAVLHWTFENFEKPQTVFVTGSSAGSIASPFYTALVAERYPNAHIAQLGDASGGYRGDAMSSVLANWGTPEILPDFPEYRDIAGDQLTFETFYIASGSRYPDIIFSQYNTAADEVQLLFLKLADISDVSLLELLQANFADINATVDNFRSYTAGGKVHVILIRPEFYTYQVDGIRFRDWITALASDEDVDNVMCTACESAE
jgi:hypothetical protein